jgi:hypothetical protein
MRSIVPLISFGKGKTDTHIPLITGGVLVACLPCANRNDIIAALEKVYTLA